MFALQKIMFQKEKKSQKHTLLILYVPKWGKPKT